MSNEKGSESSKADKKGKERGKKKIPNEQWQKKVGLWPRAKLKYFTFLYLIMRKWVATKHFGTFHRISRENNIPTIVTMDPHPKT